MEGPNGGQMLGDVTASNNYALGATFFLQGSSGARPQTGTISLTSSSNAVSGTGTKFLTDQLFGISSAGAPDTSSNNNKFWLNLLLLT
jgi:hypothetical protein